MTTDLYGPRAWEQISYLYPQSNQEHVREVWNVILEPIFHLVAPGGKSFIVEDEDDEGRFPQISVSSFGSSALFKVYCVGYADPDAELWKVLEDAVQLDLLEATDVFEGQPRASLWAAIAIGPLVRFYRLDEEDYFCYVEFRDRDGYNVHQDFNVIVDHLLHIRETMA
ncbi:hypothetical protein CDV55_105697 [Aspergillus turcosus]|uniref:Uncharacterized protein n=1 Tax=Aspergillus turcosus TaxID=1245748 RepID=A0A229YSY1_9EURO|nr:hypothetical protein CDV55_105697 [Aspergillus turcosus]RLL97855.1 hypothetical protein CFD26_104043 [Aspergillus turcosus]